MARCQPPQKRKLHRRKDPINSVVGVCSKTRRVCRTDVRDKPYCRGQAERIVARILT